MAAMTSSLILSLRGQNLKLASAMRTVSWLRRIAPELEGHRVARDKDRTHSGGGGKEGSLGALFLVCRLANLMAMLGALEPLRELADQEALHENGHGHGNSNGQQRGAQGAQTARYLKRYIEIFREQSFAIISVFRSIFPPEANVDVKIPTESFTEDPLLPLPSSSGTFPLHLVDMLLETLRTYLPNVKERSARDSLMTQVLYCAGSLGRLGGDFSLVLAFLEESKDVDGEVEREQTSSSEEEEEEEEWVKVVKRHRELAGRLESMVGAH